MSSNKRITSFECTAPVTLFRSSMSDGQWGYICHKFQIPVESEKVRSIKISSSENGYDMIDIEYEWAP